MFKLNTIFYGPAGTGKTRKAIIQAVQTVSSTTTINKSYKETLESFKKSSNLLDLKELDKATIEKIQNAESEKELNLVIENIPRGIKIDENNIKSYYKNHSKYPLIETVTFHPSYSYQDFVEGITVETSQDGNIAYTVKDGIFKKICQRALNNIEYKYVLIIDEINRGDISAIFGELFTLLEDTKRAGQDEELSINLPYSKDLKGNPEKLRVPENLYIIATMNTVDKSIALIDIALRRRFEFVECMPDYSAFENKRVDGIDLKQLLNIINKKIKVLKNEHYQIGHSYFLNINTFNELKEVIKKKIIPLLQEYFYDDWESICAVLNQPYKKPNKLGGILISEDEEEVFANTEFKELVEYKSKKVFTINELFNTSDLKRVYE